ncbi:MAG: pentapeptide repeat-containing protein [Planctomycetes bacterium]|nr:pentapeptide repeat-containing protein [Planctomycetota bacterium]
MNTSQQGQDPPEREERLKRRFRSDQYEMLLRCSEKQDISEWNSWRQLNPDELVLLEEAPLQEKWLVCANLAGAHMRGAKLEKAWLAGVRAQGADFSDASFEFAYLSDAVLSGSRFRGARMQYARLNRAHLEGVSFLGADLSHAEVEEAHLRGADFNGAVLCKARLSKSDLSGARVDFCLLWGADAQYAVVDGGTLIDTPCVDFDTDFTGVGLDSARIAPGLKQLLEYNIRRRRWQSWYRSGGRLTRLLKRIVVEPFWWLSDYGRSTARIISIFLLMAYLFSVVYCAWPVACRLLHLPFDYNLVANLFEGSDGIPLSWPAVRVRALYFSFVTMTTLGFGDMFANESSIPGHILLAIQVLLGYIMLGALVTHLAVLFTADGPANKHCGEDVFGLLERRGQ